jgi:hypothetical protein
VTRRREQVDLPRPDNARRDDRRPGLDEAEAARSSRRVPSRDADARRQNDVPARAAGQGSMGLFRSVASETSWAKPEPLEGLNNAEGAIGEVSPALSGDGSALYFASDRRCRGREVRSWSTAGPPRKNKKWGLPAFGQSPMPFPTGDGLMLRSGSSHLWEVDDSGPLPSPSVADTASIDRAPTVNPIGSAA